MRQYRLNSFVIPEKQEEESKKSSRKSSKYERTRFSVYFDLVGEGDELYSVDVYSKILHGDEIPYHAVFLFNVIGRAYLGSAGITKKTKYYCEFNHELKMKCLQNIDVKLTKPVNFHVLERVKVNSLTIKLDHIYHYDFILLR